MRRMMRCTQPVPSRQGEHCPQDSSAKNWTAESSASIMQVVSSMTITPPGPGHAAGGHEGVEIHGHVDLVGASESWPRCRRE